MNNIIKKTILGLCLFPAAMQAFSQTGEKEALKVNLNQDGSHFVQATMLNQVWLRYDQSQPGTLMQGVSAPNTFDIGLRRTRFQLFGQINDRVFVYFQFGQNNFNAQSQYAGSRKVAAFFHDAVCEYKASNGNQLKLGAGLTIANGLSRFSQPSIGTIMTMDVPVFAQATVDQTDQFSRKLSVYARGQISKLDYRFSLSDPFPITTNGQTLPALSSHSTFAQKGRHLQLQGYLMWQFLEHEGHTTPYMTGTYLGKKKVFNVAVGAIHQRNAMWRSSGADTLYQDMNLFCAESYLDMPLNKEKGTAISAYAGAFITQYGKDYLRFNGIMNPASGSSLTSLAKDAGSQFGNAYPMFGSGKVLYAQTGYLLPSKVHLGTGRLMPYASATLARFDRLQSKPCNTFNAGINWLLQGHKAKITLDYQNRPGYLVHADGNVESGARRSAVTMQYQIFF
ncbi:MAG: hypothetical protein KJS92_05955 [Bacteroidetes bacterium]|nr:hypothetical protein [Bacteroidota bacterium]